MKINRLVRSKWNVILISIFFGNVLLNAQTYIGLSISVDISNIEKERIDDSFIFTKGGKFANYSLSIGLITEHYLSDKSIISLRNLFNQKKIDTDLNRFYHSNTNQISFYHFKNSLEYKYIFLKNLKIGCGYSYNFGRKFNYVNVSYSKNNFSEHGPLFSMGLKIKNYLIEVLYWNSLSIEYDKRNSFYETKPIKSLTLSVSYMFKVRDKSKVDIECPKF